MKNILIPILGAVSVVSTGAVAWLLATPSSSDPRTAKLESELQEARQSISRLKAELARVPKASSQPAAAPIAEAPTGDAAAALQPGESGAPQDPKNLREMFNSPAMRELLSNQQAAQIEVGYAPLFEQLRLDPEDREHFKKLLTARQTALTDLGLKLMDPNLSEAERQETMAQVNHQKSVFEAGIKDFLNNPADWRNFQNWEATQPERTSFNALGRSLFSASAEPLSREQEEQLIKLMAEVRASPYSVGGLNDQTGGDPNKLTDAVIAQQLQQIDSNNRIIAEQSAAFLTPGQQQTLMTYLDQLKVMAKSSIDTSKMIIRGANSN